MDIKTIHGHDKLIYIYIYMLQLYSFFGKLIF